MEEGKNISGKPVLTATGLKKSFGETVALDGVDIAVAAGESVAVMGPGGSGKSTLLHCLAGVLVPDGGVVTLGNLRTDRPGERRRSALRRTRFGFVFREGQLLPELPAYENVALPLMLGGMSRRGAVERALGWLGRFGLSGLATRTPGQLSGGQAQRVAVARELALKPSVVFADEPTGSLDQETGHETMNPLVESATGQGAALIVVTRDPGVAGHCQRTVEIRDGKLRGDSSGTSARGEGRTGGRG